MNFTGKENYDESLVDYILDNNIQFRMFSTKLMYDDGDYCMCVVNNSNSHGRRNGFFMNLFHGTDIIYDYDAIVGTYRYDEFFDFLLKQFLSLDKSAQRNNLIQGFLGNNSNLFFTISLYGQTKPILIEGSDPPFIFIIVDTLNVGYIIWFEVFEYSDKKYPITFICTDSVSCSISGIHYDLPKDKLTYVYIYNKNRRTARITWDGYNKIYKIIR